MPVLSLSFASTSAKRPPLGVVDHYGSRKGVHPFTGSLTTFNVTGCLVYLFGEAMIMGDYHTLARRTMEIILPEGHIIPPEGCIIPPEGRRRPQVEAARRRDNAARRRNTVA